MRRVVAALAVLSVVLPGGVAHAAPRPKLPKCLTFTDPKGDAGVVAPAVTGDPALDFRQVTLSVTRDVLAVRMVVDAIGDNATKAWGDRFQLNFGYDKKAVEVYYKRSRTRDTEANAFKQQGIRVDESYVTDVGITGTYDQATNAMTLTVTLATLKSALGNRVVGGWIGNVATFTYGSFVSGNVNADEAKPPPGTAFRVSHCG